MALFTTIGAGLGAVLGAGTAVGALGGAAIGGTIGMGASSVVAGGQAADAAEQAAATEAAAIAEGSATQAGAQQAGLDYLIESGETAQQFSEEALTQLGGVYGLEGGEGSQQQLIDQAIASPLYQGIMGGQEAGEESILRSAAATGGLRSGNVQEALYDYNVQLENRALLEAYNQQLMGLTGMANLPSYAPQIAQGMANVGATQAGGIYQAGNIYAQGQVAAAQATQSGYQQGFGNLMGMAGLGISGYDAGMFSPPPPGIYSDRRLKKNIKEAGQVNGFNWYTWDWNVVAEKMGLNGSCQGVMADEVIKEFPGAVTLKNLFMLVDYSKLGIMEVCDAH